MFQPFDLNSRLMCIRMRVIWDHMHRAVHEFEYVAAPVYKGVQAYLVKPEGRAIDTHSRTAGQFLPDIRVRIPDPPPLSSQIDTPQQ
jgi:hypothetical protein